MAPKSNKRSAQAANSTQPAKVQKKAEEKKVPEDPLMEGLVSTIQSAELPEACKEMFLVMLPGSFTVPVEQRHEVQEMVVGMVGKLVEQMHGQMSKDTQEAKVELEVAEGKKEAFEATVLEAESQLTAAVETVQSKEVSLLDATKLESEKQMLFNSAKDIQTKGDVELEVVKEEKEMYATSVTNSFKMLHESDLEGSESVQHFKVIQPFIGKLALDDSLILALPSTCQRKLCDRGSFDNVIMEQLGKAVEKHIANLESTIQAGASAAAERAAAVHVAEEELNAAKGAKANAQEELITAETKRREALSCVESAKDAVTDIKVQLEKLGKGHEDKVAVCARFESWNMSCFHQLRDKSAAPREETLTPQEVPPPKTIIVDEVNSAPAIQAGA